eukprot:SAG11_NODE_675_length_7800_cov_6.380730_3_plen_62_part_00
MLDAAALDFAKFSNRLAIALHASGRRLGLDLSGDSDRYDLMSDQSLLEKSAVGFDNYLSTT